MKNIVILSNLYHDSHGYYAREIEEKLRNRFQVDLIYYNPDIHFYSWNGEEQDYAFLEQKVRSFEQYILFVLGGDGTVLFASRLAVNSNVVVFPIHLGTLGFLASFSFETWEEDFERYLYSLNYDAAPEDSFYPIERLMIKVSIEREGKKIFQAIALNECYVGFYGLAKLIYYSVFIGGRKIASYRADGGLISTPTGSTAYSLSLGSPLIYPNVDCLLFTAVNPHDLSSRSFIFSAGEKLVVLMEEKQRTYMALTLDGHEFCVLQAGDQVCIEAHEKKIKILAKEYSFYEILQKKFASFYQKENQAELLKELPLKKVNHPENAVSSFPPEFSKKRSLLSQEFVEEQRESSEKNLNLEPKKKKYD